MTMNGIVSHIVYEIKCVKYLNRAQESPNIVHAKYLQILKETSSCCLEDPWDPQWWK